MKEIWYLSCMKKQEITWKRHIHSPWARRQAGGSTAPAAAALALAALQENEQSALFVSYAWRYLPTRRPAGSPGGEGPEWAAHEEARAHADSSSMNAELENTKLSRLAAN